MPIKFYHSYEYVPVIHRQLATKTELIIFVHCGQRVEYCTPIQLESIVVTIHCNWCMDTTLYEVAIDAGRTCTGGQV